MARQTEEIVSARSPYPELLSGSLFALLGLALTGAALFHTRIPSSFERLFLYLGASFLVTAAGFLSAYLTAGARRRGKLVRKQLGSSRDARALPPALDKIRAYARRGALAIINVDWRGDWLAIVTALAFSLLALFALWEGWHSAAPALLPFTDELIVGILLVAAFPLLVLERQYAAIPERLTPEAPILERLSRVPLLAVLGLALAAGLRWLDLSFAVYADDVVAIVTGLVAIELSLRSLSFIFVPLPPLATRRSHADSFIAGLIRPQLPNLAAMSSSVRSQFGIDLARSWALGFIRRAAIPVLLGMALLSWLLTGVTALGLDQRAVYEAFGEPQAVLHPGVHVHLPWPFGVLRPVEFGMVREIAINVTPGGAQEAPEHATMEGKAPRSADRLWDSSHLEEPGYLVASFSNGQQGFEAVDIDINVLYRIGLTDAAAEQATYTIASPDTTIRAMAGQMLARYFARTTITEILEQNRDAFIRNFQKELQTRLNAINSGIEVMGVVVEAIHPPPKAAAAYQGVQSAAIESNIKVATAAAEAAREMKMAQLVANTTRNEAQADAAERIDQAKAGLTLFDADRQAHQIGGDSFIFERRLDRLDKGLADKPLIIVDHRISPADAPTFDMRRPGAGGADLAPSDD